MKKIKLLTPILTTASVATTIVPIVSCSKIEHVTLNSLEEGTQVGTKKSKYCYARYNLSLDNDTYTQDQITCKVVSDNADLFKINSTVNGYSLTLDVQYWKLELGKVKFTVEFSNGGWTQDIDLIMNIESIDTSLDDYIARYTTIQNYFLTYEQHGTYNTFDFAPGDYTELTTAEGTNRIDITDSSTQNNTLLYGQVIGKKGYRTVYYESEIDGTSIEEALVTQALSMDWDLEPEVLKDAYQSILDAGGTLTFYLPDDGSLGVYEEYEIATGYKVKQLKFANPQGYATKLAGSIEMDLYGVTRQGSYSFNISNYRKK